MSSIFWSIDWVQQHGTRMTSSPFKTTVVSLEWSLQTKHSSNLFKSQAKRAKRLNPSEMQRFRWKLQLDMNTSKYFKPSRILSVVKLRSAHDSSDFKGVCFNMTTI